jgi:hypothetical protein
LPGFDLSVSGKMGKGTIRGMLETSTAVSALLLQKDGGLWGEVVKDSLDSLIAGS